MRIGDIVQFDKSRYFGGAIQANWFYDSTKVKAIVESYVFHGPKYHGVEASETRNHSYKLYDTASYALKLIDSIESNNNNHLFLTIAGYGTGKSHLAVTLAALFSGHSDELRAAAIERIANADKDIAAKISAHSEKNLVLVLNGMNNFNLDSEFLSVAKMALEQHGISSDTALKEVTKQYDQAKHFVKVTYDVYKDKYERHCNGIDKQVLIDSIESNEKLFNAVNEVYKEINGEYMRWDSGISAGVILSLLDRKFCKEKKIFKRIIVLFDEFGRFIEYAAAHPQIAGDSALQQIFEAIQNADGDILFNGFIQYDLKQYLNHVGSSSNIERYVGRYDQSEKLYISSNFETILANLLTKKNDQSFKAIVETNVDVLNATYNSNVHNVLLRWDKRTSSRSVWVKNDMYMSVVAKGCYPLHPLTVWLLSNTSEWMQQRSTIAFASQMFDSVKDTDVSAKWLDYVYAVDVIDSDLFNEMLNSEEKGFVQSQYCMLYQEIVLKNAGRFTNEEMRALRAVLIINVCRFSTLDKNDCINAIKYCSGLSDDDTRLAVQSLENNYGVIAFDATIGRFELLANANGIHEFTRILAQKKGQLRNYDGITECDDDLRRNFSLDYPIPTPFADNNKISSMEWQFSCELVRASNFDSIYCQRIKRDLNNACDGEQLRGVFIYLYCDDKAEKYIAVAHKLYLDQGLDTLPVIISVLIDENKELNDKLKERAALKRFSLSEREDFSKFVSMYSSTLNKAIESCIYTMKSQKKYLTGAGLQQLSEKQKELCYKKFAEIYTSPIPFAFDGFEKKIVPATRKNFTELCEHMYDGSMTNEQQYQSFSQPLKNRILAVLSVTRPTSWQVFDHKYNLCEPQNSAVYKLYADVKKQIVPDTPIEINSIFRKYLYPPYGLNKYSLSLFILYVLCINGTRAQIFQGNYPLPRSEFSANVIQNDKKMFESLMKLKVVISQKTSNDVADELLKSIADNTLVENCEQLLVDLENIKKAMVDSTEYAEKFASAKAVLDSGRKLRKQLYDEKLEKVDGLLETFKAKGNIFRLITIYDVAYQINAGTQIEEYSKFVYSNEYASKINSILDETDALFDSKFHAMVNSLSCSTSEISLFKTRYKSAVKTLRRIGRASDATCLEERAQEVLAKAEAIQKYETSLIELEKDLVFVKDTGRLNYCDCSDNLRKLDNWTKFISGTEDLDSKTRNEYVAKLSEAKTAIESQMEKYRCEVDKCISIFEKGGNFNVNEFCAESHKLLDLHFPDDISRRIQEALNSVNSYRTKLSSVSDNLSELEEMVNEYSDTPFEYLIKNEIAKTKDKYHKQSVAWMQRNVYSKEGTIPTMSVTECSTWQSVISDLPKYLGAEDLVRVEETRNLIKMRMKQLKIEGVIQLFNELSDSEKEECLSLLNKHE